MTTQIEALWSRLEGELGGALRVDDSHPCDLYASVDAAGRRGLVLVTDESPPRPPALEALEVVVSRRGDGRHSLAIWLENPGLSTLFTHLSQDLVDEIRLVDPTTAGSFMLSRLERWRRLLRGERGLALHEIRGLVAELLVMEQCLGVWRPVEVVEAWLGPVGSAQDFVLPSTRLEVKAIQPDARTVHISSADQLDTPDPLMLAVVSLTTLIADDRGISVTQVSARIRDQLRSDGHYASIALLDQRLRVTGMASPDVESAVHFRLDGIRYYRVLPDFPALTRAGLPNGVAEVSYEIELGALQPYQSDLGG
jgi:hypothetical protein